MLGKIGDTYKSLKKAGAAQLVIEISLGPSDLSLAGGSPHVEIKADAIDRETGEVVDTVTKDISSQTDRVDRILALRVETEVGTLARFFQRKKPGSLLVKVTAKPIPPWDGHFQNLEREVTVQAGEVRTVGLPLVRKESPYET